MDMSNLYQASAQWAVRPNDERFWNVQDLKSTSMDYYKKTKRMQIPYSDLEISASAPSADNPHGEILLKRRSTGTAGTAAKMTHFAFGQLCARAIIEKDDRTISAPASFLRMLPAPLAVDCLRYGLSGRDGTEIAQLQFHQNGSLICKSITTDIYNPYWNHEIADRLNGLSDRGWKVPPARSPYRDPGECRTITQADSRIRPATASDVLDMESIGGQVVKIGDPIAPSGLYASDHDLFAFMINPTKEIENGLFRGAFFWNSEVGNKSFGGMTFLFRSVCGNHIVWDVSDVSSFRLRHTGDIQKRAADLFTKIMRETDASTDRDRQRLTSARARILGTSKETVLETVYKMRITGLSKKRAESAFDVAAEYAEKEPSASGLHGLAYDPMSAWGYAQGLTRLSQTVPYADERNILDRAAGALVCMN